MKLILLAWNNKNSNQDWIQEVEKKFADLFDQTYIQHYDHWIKGSPDIDLENESNILLKNIDWVSDYVIFAKSAWTVLAIKSIYEKNLNPKACIFVGMPMGMVFRNEFPYENWFKNSKIPTLFIQKANDPVCSFQELKNLLWWLSDSFQFVEVEWNTHYYEDVDLLRKLVGDFINKK